MESDPKENPKTPAGRLDCARELDALSKSRIYRDYERAFTEATGLPILLHSPDMQQMIRYSRDQENPFCSMMARTNETCGQCYLIQRRLEQEAQLEPKTLKCFAGLCETAVPVRVGDKLVAFLQTGQILLHRPDNAKFNKITQALLRWGAEIDVKRLEEAYFNTRVLTSTQYEALIRLLVIFAEHLASCSNALSLQSQEGVVPSISRAKIYISENSGEELSLEAVSKVVNMSANYFSEKFKEATGLNFVDYVSRTRVEKACHLLQNPNMRVSEIAFDVGFQSLSQFNRSFKKVMGKSPRDYRETVSLQRVPA